MKRRAAKLCADGSTHILISPQKVSAHWLVRAYRILDCTPGTLANASIVATCFTGNSDLKCFTATFATSWMVSQKVAANAVETSVLNFKIAVSNLLTSSYA